MSLAKKILKVMAACRSLTYDSNNDEVGYKYVSAAKVNAAVNAALVDNGVITLAESELKEIREFKDEVLATVEVEITLQDVDSEEQFVICGVGQGIDAGDKAVAKAQTMAVKYAWKNSLLIADTADDPDANINTQVYKSTPAESYKSTPAERPSELAKTGSRLSRAAEMAKAPF